MPAYLKCFIHNTLVEVCFRTEEGLPLIPAPYMQLLLTTHLARAQTLYPVEIPHFIVMGNHIHIMFVVGDPENIPAFIEYFKRESAHTINRLLGRRRRTVWIDRYDSPVILDAEKAIDRIVYFYANPLKANLVATIDDYPNLNSWQAFLNGGQTITCARIARDSISALPKRAMSFVEQEKLADSLRACGKEECTLILSPNAWLKCFRETRDSDPTEIKERIIKEIRLTEQEHRDTRKVSCVGAHALKLQPIWKLHTPLKYGRKMICLASTAALRKPYIKWFRERCALVDSRTHTYPGGMFAPGGFLFSNVLPFAVPIICEALR